MLTHIRAHHEQSLLRQLVVTSRNSRAFYEPLDDPIIQGVQVIVFGFREHASFTVSSGVLSFEDLEPIP